jgi:hypothetical protein
MLANSAATLPKGGTLIETYVFDVVQRDTSLRGSLTYLLHGVTDRLTLGIKPMFGAQSVNGKARELGIGDLTVSGQYRLTSPHRPAGKPTISLSLQQSLPIGRYDRLDTRPSSALGSGVYATTISFYGQQYFWLPNGRIFRGRLNLSQSFSGPTKIAGESVYGTSAGFRGRVGAGMATSVGLSGEYSVTRSWALALDVVVTRAGSVRVRGVDPTRTASLPVEFDTGVSEAFAIAPGVEYSWTPNLGVLFASRFVLRGHNAEPSITPAVAINYVF